MHTVNPNNTSRGYKLLSLSKKQISTLVISTIIAIICVISTVIRDAVMLSLIEAYIQVSSFVAVTLAIFYILERKYAFDTQAFLAKHRKFQVPIATLLGALPGCGGAIIAVTQYSLNRLSFGALIATLTATMGDAAFLLISKEPITSGILILMQCSAGIITGYIVDFIHGPSFMKFEVSKLNRPKTANIHNEEDASLNVTNLDILWVVLIIPGFMLGILNALQIQPSSLGLGYIPEIIAISGALLSIALWASRPFFMQATCYIPIEKKRAQSFTSAIKQSSLNIINNTNFVTIWVIIAFLSFNLPTFIWELDVSNIFKDFYMLTPLIAGIIGFLPGCGPQIIVTTLYLGGVIPFSAQICNAISNDGDALFPAIALAPKSSILATIYSFVPAISISYTYLYFFES